MDNLDDIVLGFIWKVGVLTSSCLVLLLGGPFNSMVAWDEVEERFYNGYVEKTIS